MNIAIAKTREDLGGQAALKGIQTLQSVLSSKKEANIILATGVSQLSTLSTLLQAPLDWSRITVFHLDEYIGLPVTHAASFRKYLRERFVEKLPAKLKSFHEIDGNANPAEECHRLNELISQCMIDIAFVGIGENAHLAFNDPPADFETEKPYIVVELDEHCRQQQVGEGWFTSMNEVPRQAISMSCRQILKSRQIICSVPGKVKAEAVRNTITAENDPQVPSSILKQHPDTHLYLDLESAELLPAHA
jgi:glucosamine-6-phosphate deaminase